MNTHYGRLYYFRKTLWISPTQNYRPTPMEIADPSIQLLPVIQLKSGEYRAKMDIDDVVFVKAKSEEANELDDVGSYEGAAEVVKLIFNVPDPRQDHPVITPTDKVFYWKTLTNMGEENKFRVLRMDLVHDISWQYGKDGLLSSVYLRAVNDDYTIKIDDRVNTHQKWTGLIKTWLKEFGNGI